MEVKETLQTNDQGEVLFFPHPPQSRSDQSKIPSDLRTSLKYRIERVRQRAAMEKNKEESKVKVEETTGSYGVAASKRSSTNDANAIIKRLRTNGNLPSMTSPIGLTDIDVSKPEASFHKINSARVDPSMNAQYIRAFGVGYKDFIQGMLVRHQQFWASLVPEAKLAQVMKQSVSDVADNVHDVVAADAKQKEQEEEEKKSYFWKTRAAMNKQPEFFLEDRDPLYCGLTWTGPNPYPFNGGSGVKKD